MAECWSSCILLISVTMAALHSVHAVHPAIYIFGDSTVDVGTNSHLNHTIFRADFPYNGIDFPVARATGRFSNGFNTADFIALGSIVTLAAKYMGFRRSPSAFLDTVNQRNLHPRMHVINGVNFASGGAGIFDKTRSAFVVPFNEQIRQMQAVHQKLETLFGQDGTDSFLSKSLFCISIGSNDIFEHYYITNNTLDKEFINTVVNTYEKQLRKLYSIGARKFGIISIPPIGCCPSQRAFNVTGGCLETMNEYSLLFFFATKTMLQKLSSELKDLKYSLGDTYQMVAEIMENPLAFNIKELKWACCGEGKFNGQNLCSETAKLCSNRNKYLFWDWFHPTENVAQMAAETLYTGRKKYVSPINFKQLLEA